MQCCAGKPRALIFTKMHLEMYHPPKQHYRRPSTPPMAAGTPTQALT